MNTFRQSTIDNHLYLNFPNYQLTLNIGKQKFKSVTEFMRIWIAWMLARSYSYNKMISLSLSPSLSNMMAFVYILNICEYDVPNMYIMYTCVLCILLSLSLSLLIVM